MPPSASSFISSKRYGQEHSPVDVASFISSFHAGTVTDYQMSAWLMAVCLKGMTPLETAALTKACVDTGVVCDLSSVPGPSSDKHSTGGVGDKVSLVLAPVVASLGVTVPMMSGRGLGHTGGTLDKLQSIPGYDVELTADQFRDVLRKVGCAIVAPGRDMAPVDKRIYAIRDVTATVRAIPLQTSSIMCKKIAENPDSLVLDVKFGKGSFNPEVDESIALAKSMVKAGEAAGKQTTAFITRMDEPIGFAVGNWLEVHESLLSLSGKGPRDLDDLTVVQAGQMLVQAGKARDLRDGVLMARKSLKDGSALAKFVAMARAQGGDAAVLLKPETYPLAAHVLPVVHEGPDGVVTSLDSLAVGNAAVYLGAGRARAADGVDAKAGVRLTRKCGDSVKRGDVIAYVHGDRGEDNVKRAGFMVGEAFGFGRAGDYKKMKLITHVVTKDSVEEFDESVLRA